MPYPDYGTPGNPNPDPYYVSPEEERREEADVWLAREEAERAKWLDAGEITQEQYDHEIAVLRDGYRHVERLALVGPLQRGSHERHEAMCLMESVAFVAGEPWSDHPQCACPVISAFLRGWNDALPDEERDALLRPLILRVVGTRRDAEVERRRALMAADWLVRVHTPAWLRLARLDKQADTLASLPEITDMAQCPSLRPALAAARDAAHAARAAARDAAGDAAAAVAWDAAGAALKVTRLDLQQSALRLVERMIAA